MSIPSCGDVFQASSAMISRRSSTSSVVSRGPSAERIARAMTVIGAMLGRRWAVCVVVSPPGAHGNGSGRCVFDVSRQLNPHTGASLALQHPLNRNAIQAVLNAESLDTQSVLIEEDPQSPGSLRKIFWVNAHVRNDTVPSGTCQEGRTNMGLETSLSSCVNWHMDAAKLVIDLREHLGLTQEAFAQRAGVERTRIAKIENGANKATSGDVREALARAAGVSLEAMVGYLKGRITLENLLLGRSDTHSDTQSEKPRTVPVPPVEAPENAGILERALFSAMDPTQFEPEDFDRARTAGRESFNLLKDHSDIDDVAKGLLQACRKLRRGGLELTTANVMTAWAVGVSERAREQSRSAGALMEADGDEALRQLGREPGDSAHVGEKASKLLDRMMKRRVSE